MSLFPLIDLPELETEQGGQMQLFREVAWNFRENRPIWRGGEPVYVTGASAVLVWAWNALHALRGRHDIFTRDYGLGIRELTGKGYNEQIRRSEAIRYVREALLTNPYITAVEAVSISFEGSLLTISCKIQSVYGEVQVNGCTI